MFINLILIPSYQKWNWYIKTQSLISLYDKLQNYGEVIKPVFKNYSVREAIDNTEIPNEDPFKHLSEYKHTLWKKETT